MSHHSSKGTAEPAAHSHSSHFRLHHLARPECYRGSQRPSFYSAYARAARRYGFETGKHAGFAMRNNVVCKVLHHNKETEHEVPAESIQNGEPALEYVVPVRIGTPGVTLNLDFDTGSSDLWVWSTEVARASSYTGHHLYNPKKSKSAKHAQGTWNISYGDGSSASGEVYTDTVKVAGVTVPGQAIEVAQKLSSAFLKDGGNDGLLGLAWPSINTVKPHPVATPVGTMISKRLINPPVFTVKLGHGTESSFYSFGFIDTTVTPNPITYTPVDNSQGFWQVSSRAYVLDRKQIARSGNTAILDTGTSLCLVEDQVVEKIYGASLLFRPPPVHVDSACAAGMIDRARFSSHQGGWVYPKSAKVPEVGFAVGDRFYYVNEVDFGFGDADEGWMLGGIQSRGDLDFDIFGDVFLKSVYVVFNQGEKTVGVAQRDD
ncbi:acid protease [Amylocystis lapponica]|nr:acid protease [Amylocystis lapponica]